MRIVSGKKKANLGEVGDRGFSPGYGKIVDFKKKRDINTDFYVVVGTSELEAVLLHYFSSAIDKLCCFRCSDKTCEERDGSCWEYEEV